MIGEGYRSFREATAFDDGYRRACSDMLGFLESIRALRIVSRDGMEMFRVLCVPENLDGIASGVAELMRRPKDDANGDGRYFVKPAKTARKSPESIQEV